MICKFRPRTLAAVLPWALVASTAVALAQAPSPRANPLPPGSPALPGAPADARAVGAGGRLAESATILPRGDTVATRARPEYDPLGIRAGGFLVFPQFTVEETYNDNIFATGGNKTDDFITSLRPEMTIESNWSRHAFAIAGGGDFGIYAQNDRENYQDWFAATDGRVDLTRDAAIYLGGGAARRHEDRGSPDSPTDAKEPTIYYNYNAFARYDQTLNRFSITVDGVFDRLDYDNTPAIGGGDVRNNDRDRNVYSAPIRFGYEITPQYEAFVRAVPNLRRYDQTPDAGGLDRDSWGYSVAGGLSLDFGGLTFGEVYAGYLQQFYDDSDLGTTNAPTFGGALTWNAATLTTLNVGVERTVQETTAAGASSYISTSGGLTIDHELLRNVILTARGTVTNNDYQDINRTDWYYIAGASVRYLLNRNLYATAGYTFRHRTSDADNNFDQNLFRIGLQTQL